MIPSPGDSTRPARMGYQPGLDGLRALSVVLVILYHAGVVRDAEAPAGTAHRWFVDGGFLGVEVFFVVSGFLITSLLLEERARTGRVSLRQFWFRRFRRLLPALWVMIAVAGVWATLWGTEFLADLKWDAFFGLFYGANFQQLFGKVSYFGGFPHLLRHLWSLAVEEHFYLFFPLVFVLVLRHGTRPARRLLWFSVPAALASVSALALVWQRPVERLTDRGAQLDDLRQNWAYLSTFTRVGGILIGVSLAVVWSPWARVSAGRDRRLDAAGLAAMAGVVAASMLLTSHSAALYRGGLTAVSLLSAVAIAAVVHPGATAMRAVFGNKVMAAIGRRSYGLYLWHWPIFVGPFSGWDLGPRLAAGGAATVVASELCYRFVETPLRQGALGRWFRSANAAFAARRHRVRFAVPILACTAGFGLLVGALTVRLVTVEKVDPVVAASGDGPAEVFDESAVLDALLAPTTLVPVASTATPTGPATRPSSVAVTTLPGVTTTTAAATSTLPARSSGRTPSIAPPIPVANELPPLPRRVVMVGDSQADSLFHNLPDGLSGVFALTNGALQGCSVWSEGRLHTSLPKYSLGFDRCAGWERKWADKVRRSQADVALVVLGAWDVFDMTIGDRRLVFGTPEWDEYWMAQLERGIKALRYAGAEVALLEVACMRPQNVKGQGTPALPERRDDTRTGHINELLAQAAAADPTHVYYLPGPTQWCDDEAVASDLFYRWDGVHASRKGGKLIMEAIAPELLSIPVPTTRTVPTTRPEPGPP